MHTLVPFAICSQESPAALLETSEKICPGFSFLPGLLELAESDLEIWPQYVPSVLLPVHKKHGLR